MKTKYFFLAAFAAMLASCANEEYVGDNSPDAALEQTGDGSIQFTYNLPNRTRAGEFVGATAAEKLGGMFVVEGTKGSEKTNSPSTTVVFDNYLVGYTANTAGKTESNTHNWEYVGKQTGIASRMTGETWNALHAGSTDAKVQSIKYWDYSTDQYDFIAWSTGELEAVTTDPTPGREVQVTRISTGEALKTNGFTLKAANADDLLECYYTDIITAKKDNGAGGTDYGKPVTLTFRNMAAKVRVALYETVPGYSVQGVEFYQDETTALTADVSSNEATLYTPDDVDNQLPQSGTVTVIYPRIGSNNSGAADYNKASVTVSAGSTKSSTQTFGALSGTIGTSLPSATFAGSAADDYYKAVIPNTNGKPLTLRVNYTLVSTDGSGETIKIYGAKAVVPATYTNWLPNYAYTYIFKISDNSNGWTDTDKTAQGLLPITFDAVVTSFVDANAEQTTVTTVATPSITTYQQGHNTGTNGAYTVPDEYSNDGAKLYVKVMNDGTAITNLSNSNSLFFEVTTTSGIGISEATVMDALQNRTSWDSGNPVTSPEGRNGITLTTNSNIVNNVTSIVNDVNDQPITVTEGQAAEIAIASLDPGTYAYVYCTTVPSANEVVYNVASVSNNTEAGNYYEVDPTALKGTSDATAQPNKVYFVANHNAQNAIESYTFKQTKLGDSVTGLYEATIDLSTASKATTYTVGHFYFDVYNQNNGAYAVKVIKVVE